MDLDLIRFKMKLLGFLLGLSQLILVSPSIALTLINDDVGGSLGEYLLKFAEIRDSGDYVVIDGSCSSACTLVTAMIPKERVCITDRARLGFHVAWIDDHGGHRSISAEGTRLLYQMYPPSIQNWIMRHGGLGVRTIVLEGRELATFYTRCK
jgi:hypothetical protein